VEYYFELMYIGIIALFISQKRWKRMESNSVILALNILGLSCATYLVLRSGFF